MKAITVNVQFGLPFPPSQRECLRRFPQKSYGNPKF
jgi:hypothetical protein